MRNHRAPSFSLFLNDHRLTQFTMMTAKLFWLLCFSFIVRETAAAPRLLVVSATSLLLPPTIRLGMGGEKDLQKDCEAVSSAGFVWAGEASQGYQVATTLFQALAKEDHSFRKTTVWFPAFTETSVLEGLVQVINDNTDRLGGVSARAEAWPKTPCHSIELSWSKSPSLSSCLLVDSGSPLSASVDAAAVSATEAWVDNTLCRLNLCPYTASLTRAAVGLESANVGVGPIVVRRTSVSSTFVAAAALLAATFWEGVSEIATTPEEEVATSLLIAPAIYDEHFVEFVSTCDNLVEASIQVVQADAIVGRAWFHPRYCEDAVGSDMSQIILAGHALPASMVKGFVDKSIKASSITTIAKEKEPSFEMVVRANNAVRWTPHATINLLRRSQLTAAKQVERAGPNMKPNAIYARNVMKIIADEEGDAHLLF